MAIQFTDFSSKPLLDAPGKDIFEDILKGYQMGKEPANMKRDADAKDLANKLKQLDVEHKPKQYDLDDKSKSLANAIQQKALDTYDARWQIEKDQKEAANALKNKEYANYDQKQELERRYKESTIAKNLADHKNKGNFVNTLEYRNNLDPNSPTYDKDYKATTAYLKNLAKDSGMGNEITANGEPIKVDLPDGKVGYVPGLGKMPVGTLPVYDEHGSFIGVNAPADKEFLKQWKGKTKFNIVQPFLNKALSVYSGSGSWADFTKDQNNYSKDPAAKQRIDDFFAARRLMAVTSTTENARIGGHATNAQIDKLLETLDSSEVHKRLEQGATITLPKGYAEVSGKIFKKYMDEMDDAATKNIPAYEFRVLNAPKTAASNDDKQKELASSIASIKMPKMPKMADLNKQEPLASFNFNDYPVVKG